MNTFRLECACPADLNPNSAYLVSQFAGALAAKLHASQLKYGYQAEWSEKERIPAMRAELIRHVGKGDPLDVAAFSMFLWWHQQPTFDPLKVPDEAFRQAWNELKKSLYSDEPLDRSVTINERAQEIRESNERARNLYEREPE